MIIVAKCYHTERLSDSLNAEGNNFLSAKLLKQCKLKTEQLKACIFTSHYLSFCTIPCQILMKTISIHSLLTKCNFRVSNGTMLTGKNGFTSHYKTRKAKCFLVITPVPL